MHFRYFFSNLGLLLDSFDPEIHKDFRDVQILLVGPKLAELLTKNRTFLTLAIDFLTTAVLSKNKAAAKAKARDPKK